MKKATEQWLSAALDDLRVIEKIVQDDLLTNMVAFHAQQAVEKSLKAIIEEYELASVRIHSLERLFEIVRSRLELEVDSLIVEALDKLYLDAQYPGSLGLLPHGRPSLTYAEKLQTFAQDVHIAIRALLEAKE